MDQSLVHVSEKAAKLENAQAAMSYRFTDPHILWEALQAASSGVHSAGNRVIIDGNKRLAMIGDAILKLVLLENSYARGDPRGTQVKAKHLWTDHDRKLTKSH